MKSSSSSFKSLSYAIDAPIFFHAFLLRAATKLEVHFDVHLNYSCIGQACCIHNDSYHECTFPMGLLTTVQSQAMSEHQHEGAFWGLDDDCN